MSSRNRPKSNNRNGLTWNGGRTRGTAPGSASAGNAPAPPKASSPALLRLFAPATRAAAAAQVVAGRFGGPAADVDELAAPAGRPSLHAGVGAALAAAAAPGAGLGTQASSRSGTVAAVSGPDVLLTAAAGAHVGRRVEVLTAANRATSFTPAPGGQVAAG